MDKPDTLIKMQELTQSVEFIQNTTKAELCAKQFIRMGLPEDIAWMLAYANCGMEAQALEIAATKRAEQEVLLNATKYMEKISCNSIDDDRKIDKTNQDDKFIIKNSNKIQQQ